MNNEFTIYLRPIELEDMEFRTRWLNDQEINSMLLITPPLSVSDSMKWYQRVLSDPNREDLTICKTEHNLPIGIIGISNISPEHLTGEIYIYIGEKSEWGKGYAKLAIERLLEFAKSSRGIRKLYLYTLDCNEKARRIYKDLGFSNEGIYKSHVYKNGVYQDLHIQSIFI